MTNIMSMACGILALNCRSYVALKLAFWTLALVLVLRVQASALKGSGLGLGLGLDGPGLGLCLEGPGLGLSLAFGFWLRLQHCSIVPLCWVEIFKFQLDWVGLGLVGCASRWTGWIGSHKMDPWTTLIWSIHKVK